MGTIGLHEIALIGILGVFLLSIVFWLWMLIDCIQHEAEEGGNQMKWAVIISITGIFGATAYFFLRRFQRGR